MRVKKVTLLIVFILAFINSKGQTVLVNGTITNEKNNPLPFAFVKDSQYHNATFSNAEGTFSLDVNPASSLIITSSNYKEVKVEVNNNQSVKIVMVPAPGSSGTAVTGQTSGRFEIHESGVTDRSARPLARFGTAQEELHGSPYLFNNWVHGYALTNLDSIKENDGYLFNYEKTSGILLYTDDGKTMNALDRTNIKKFIFFDDNAQPVTFESVPAIDPKHYLQVLGSGKKYNIYKQLNTKFLKADFQTNGISSSGNNYDSYVDEGKYYIYQVNNGGFHEISLRKKSIKAAFPAEISKINTFMSQHDADELDDNYLKNLGDFINE